MLSERGVGLKVLTVLGNRVTQQLRQDGIHLNIEPSDREWRVLLDIRFMDQKLKIVAEIKDCPECHARTKGRFPENMPEPLQYGDGIKALVNDLLIAQMLSLCRCVELVQAIILNSAVEVWYWPILVDVFTLCRLV